MWPKVFAREFTVPLPGPGEGLVHRDVEVPYDSRVLMTCSLAVDGIKVWVLDPVNEPRDLGPSGQVLRIWLARNDVELDTQKVGKHMGTEVVDGAALHVFFGGVRPSWV